MVGGGGGWMESWSPEEEKNARASAWGEVSDSFWVGFWVVWRLLDGKGESWEESWVDEKKSQELPHGGKLETIFLLCFALWEGRVEGGWVEGSLGWSLGLGSLGLGWSLD